MKLNLKKKPVKKLATENKGLEKNLTPNVAGGLAFTNSDAECHGAEGHEH
ncbi:hypothetical protein [Pseudoalteromonas sp. R3]|nr:hypothetical protein [Pseudoalteromonas sp. R3]